MPIRRAVFIVVLAFGGHLALTDASASRSLPIVVDAELNLLYQLDCLSGVVRCTGSQMGLTTTDNDAPVLAQWRSLRQSEAVVEGAATDTVALTLPNPSALRRVSSRRPPSAGTARRYTTTERATIRETVLQHFRPRFTAHWLRHDRGHLQRMQTGLDVLADDIDLPATLERLERLFATENLAPPAINLLAIRSGKDGSLATIAMMDAFVETPLTEDPRDRLPVIVHEYVHHWLANISAAQQQLFDRGFTDQSSVCAIPAYHLFDEAIATAIGNGYLERRLRSQRQFARYQALPESFYADPAIDRVAKTVLPLVERYVTDNRQIDIEFIRQYVRDVEQVLGAGCNDLALQLRTTGFLLGTRALEKAQQLAHRTLGSTTVFSDLSGNQKSALHRYRKLSGIAVVNAAELSGLAGLVDQDIIKQLGDHAGRHERLVFAWERSRHSTLYIVVGTNTDASAAALLQLIALKKQRFEGLWIPPALPTVTRDARSQPAI